MSAGGAYMIAGEATQAWRNNEACRVFMAFGIARRRLASWIMIGSSAGINPSRGTFDRFVMHYTRVGEQSVPVTEGLTTQG
jgi:hypothetical protein